jgi:hypothetical protein
LLCIPDALRKDCFGACDLETQLPAPVLQFIEGLQAECSPGTLACSCCCCYDKAAGPAAVAAGCIASAGEC